MDAQRKLLDSLMGKNRNGDMKETTKHFTDDDVCKNYLCGLCPHELFNNTKMDCGECPKKHSQILRQDYEESSKTRDYGFELELMATLQAIVDDCDRKITKANKRIQANAANKETISFAASIQALYTKAEELGEQGQIDESEALLKKAEELKREQAAKQVSRVRKF
jgi:RNA-binding protein Luc7-like 2